MSEISEELIVEGFWDQQIDPRLRAAIEHVLREVDHLRNELRRREDGCRLCGRLRHVNGSIAVDITRSPQSELERAVICNECIDELFRHLWDAYPDRNSTWYEIKSDSNYGNKHQHILRMANAIIQKINTPLEEPPVSDLYFARSLLGGELIKIGISRDVPRRLAALSAEPIAVAEGKGYLEKLIHDKFKESRVHGEWFHPTEELLKLIEKYRDPELNLVSSL